MKTGLIVVLILLISDFSVANSQEKQTLVLLKPESCTALSEDMIIKLPGTWDKYKKFVKICNLSSSKQEHADLISVWGEDYYEWRYPPKTIYKEEDFPLPLIIDGNFKILGELPEHYPYDPPREMDVYYYKSVGIPKELHIKIYNPAVSGDYSYPPIRWNESNKRYQMDTK
jgi:hypothetical protein